VCKKSADLVARKKEKLRKKEAKKGRRKK